MGVVSPTVDEVEIRVLAIAERAEAAVAVDYESIRLDDGSHRPHLVRLFDSLDDSGQRALAMWAHQRCTRRYDRDTSVERWLVRVASTRRLGWTVDEVRWLFAQPKGPHAWWAHLHLLPLAAAESLAPDSLAPLAPAFEEVLEYMQSRYSVASAEERRTLGTRLRSLLGQARPSGHGFPAFLLHNGDAFGPAAREEFAGVLASPGVADLLSHCAAQPKVEPTRKWRTEANDLLASAPRGLEAVRGLLELFGRPRERQTDGECSCCGGRHVVFAHEDTDTLVRGMLWLVADLDDDWVTPLLAQVTTVAATGFSNAPGYPHAPRTANSAVLALSRRPGQVPLATLARLAVTVKNKALRTRLQAALASLGALRGWSLAEVMELAVDDHGLGADGRLVEKLGEYEAVVEVLADKARLSFARAGMPLKGVPAAVTQAHGDRLKQLRALVKEIGQTLAAERQRVESLLSEERVWTHREWVERYLEHPITGTFGRRLLWETTVDGDSWHPGLPSREADEWVLLDADGAPARGEQIRLWHPIRAGLDEVSAWRDHLMVSGLRQPFKQAFREVYLLTPAEEETRAYSNRFAGHILRYRQANALLRARGWQAGYLGGWDGGYDSEATKEFGGGHWRASFYHELVENEDRGDYEARYCSTDQVRFARRDGAVWVAATMSEAPPLVFSEAMRDVDLFVGVTSIAADPQWADRGEDRFHAYWESTVFGELTASAQVRRDALARLLPRTKIADRVELTERFLRVRGTRRVYKIHLGSGNILMEPNDSYLCIVAARDKGSSLHLPFEEDPMLSMVLSKAFLLAADDKITDVTILRQIRP